MNTALVHIIAGATGAGKSTYAAALCQRVGAVRFSIDEWMGKLFWMDSPQPIRYEWTIERINRCEAMIFAMVRDLAQLGISSVLDLGFTKADHRAKFYDLVKAETLSPRLHWVDVPVELRWERVIQRNELRGKTFVMEVDREMFDFMESIWEPPLPDEMASANGVHAQPL
jgi:predicted kinase